MNKLYEIIVPTMYGDTEKPISTKHHKNWDKFILKITSGLTILSPSKGKWVCENKSFFEKVIPVRIMCDEKFIDRIVSFTKSHYRQKAVMYYVVSDEVFIV